MAIQALCFHFSQDNGSLNNVMVVLTLYIADQCAQECDCLNTYWYSICEQVLQIFQLIKLDLGDVSPDVFHVGTHGHYLHSMSCFQQITEKSR